jgi:hypothetical protein
MSTQHTLSIWADEYSDGDGWGWNLTELMYRDGRFAVRLIASGVMMIGAKITRDRDDAFEYILNEIAGSIHSYNIETISVTGTRFSDDDLGAYDTQETYDVGFRA